MTRLLFERFPRLRETLPWVPLADLPTPVHRLDRLGKDAGLAELWIKRDDASSTVYGGNKPRKLEFLLADARAAGKDEIVTCGGAGTNHGVAVTLLARSLGMTTTLVASPQPVLSYVRANIAAYCEAGAKVVPTGGEVAVVLAALRYCAACRVRGGPAPYFMWFGGSSAVGVIGFVEAAFELAAQVAAGDLPCPRYVVVPVGSCGTQAGLELGLRLAGLPTRVIGVAVVPRAVTNRHVVARMANAAARLLHDRCDGVPRVYIRPRDVVVLHDYLGAGYGHPTAAGKDAMRRMIEAEGIALDPTYTGKTVAGLLDWATRAGLSREPILYWLTLNRRDVSGAEVADAPASVPPALRDYFTRPLADPEL
jgi:D-cysteine desulfhydrase